MAYEDNMMDDESAPSTADNAPDETEPKDENKSDETEDQLSLVPKHFFNREMKPGDREMVEVVQSYDGEYSVRCVYGDKDDKNGKEENESPAEEKMESEEDSMMM